MDDEAREKMIAHIIGPEAISMSNRVRANLEREEEIIVRVEKERVESVVREHEELHAPYTEDCPICLDAIHISCAKSMLQLFCCGYGVCPGCVEKSQCKCKNCGRCKESLCMSNV